MSLNMQVKSLSYLKVKHVEQYADARLSQGSHSGVYSHWQ
ncbi:phage integrase N-terminal domain-containing protein [Photorhabdus heterorhabditis]|nr:phage integrase N-terminal domain-containing protein [Photorhabdus heterorhabditis]